MRKATVATVQMDCEPMNTEGNMETALALIRAAKKRGAELAVLPHMFATGYNILLHPSKLAEALNGPTVTFLRTVSQKLKLSLVGGFIEKSGSLYYDTTMILDDRGEVAGSYRRASLWPDEENEVIRGDDLCVFELPLGRAGLLISRDLSIPEMARTLAFEGADILLISAAMEDHAYWEVFARARAMENACYVVAANRIGIEGELSYCGHSMIVDPSGRVISDSESRQEASVAELDPVIIETARSDDWQLVELSESFGLEAGEYLSEPIRCRTTVVPAKKKGKKSSVRKSVASKKGAGKKKRR